MNKHRSVMDMIAEATDIPAELLPGMPLMELTGNSRFLLENHCGISEYACDCICVKVSFGCVRILGANLRITKMQRKLLVIVGKIERVELERGRHK